MSRPRRAAVLNRKKPEELELSEESDDGDFSSGDSDDYDPEKSKTNNAESESEEEEFESELDESAEASESSPEKFSRKSNSKRGFVSTLRGKTGNSYLKAKNQDLSLSSIKEILAKAQYQKRKINSQEDESVPQFDCSGGLKLSDSEEDDDDEDEKTSQKSTKTFKRNNLIDSINESSKSSLVDLKKLHDNYQDYETAKEKMKTYKKSAQNGGASQKENLNIADLLALGEKTEKVASQKRSRVDDSDSDDAWEDVEGDQLNRKDTNEPVEVVINPFLQVHKEKAKEVDLEAQMKRKFNRRLKEIQVYLHKTNLMAWIAHGHFVNKKMNDTNLMKTALEMLPKNKKQCYPVDKTDIGYIKQITNWFKSTVDLRNKSMYCNFKPRPKILTSLALQMKFKAAISRRDYTLMYVALLRAIGIQCRIVQSHVCHPILPPKDQLMSLSKKTEGKDSKNSSRSSSSTAKKSSSSSKKNSDNSKKSSSSSKSSSKSKSSSSKSSSKSSKSSSKSKSQPKIPQLDGVDDEPKRTRRSVKLKGSSSFHVEESFVDLKKKDSPVIQKVGIAKTKIATKTKRVSIPTSTANSPLTSQKSSNTQSKSGKSQVDKMKNEEMLFSPRRLRSRSKSVDQPPIPAKKVNLQKLAVKRLAANGKSNEVESKKPKIESKPETKKPNLKKLKDQMEKEDIKSPKESTSASKRKPDKLKVEEVRPKKTRVSFKDEQDEDSDSSAKLFKTKTNKAMIDRRVLSSDDEDVQTKSAPSSPSKQSKGIDIWAEVYSEVDERWIAVDIFRNKVDCVKDLIKSATHPLVYVFAYNNDNSIKDVSARYCPNLNTTVRKMRVDTAYLSAVLSMFAAPRTSRDFKENEELNEIIYAQEKPKAISEYKNHPLYALRRHLLKYEAIYPPEPPILGYIRDEAIYPRDCVYVLHTRETWLKEARTVKLNEEPYKISKTLKWDKATNKIIKDVPQELFGRWQTQDYEPPVAENGMVPRNAYGNVELFKPCMLPIGTVHLQLPGLNRICKKLNVDCAQAVVGFDSNGGWPFPVYDGFIICQEFEEKVLDAWNRDRDEQEKKEQEKYEKRVYGNWKKLIKGLFIRQRLKNKYNFDTIV